MSKIGSLTGHKVRLRALRKSTDFAKCLVWINDPEVACYLKLDPPVSEQQEEAWFSRVAVSTTEMVFSIDTLEGEHIGTMGLNAIDYRNRVATSGTLIGEKDYWGRGYGTDAKMVLLEYAFHTLGLHRVKSLIFADNERSIRMNLRCGYQREGLLRQERFKDGRYLDEVALGVLQDEWEPLWRSYSLRAPSASSASPR